VVVEPSTVGGGDGGCEVGEAGLLPPPIAHLLADILDPPYGG
jgi:hypothetical protein